ncbi:probable ribonuclease ZC3H12D [Toxorhynchites rutilus septentrionalis]|uniref:probable ribonuclease ZC3H12D n=1 Tax=Toxorhynchites rutilus septentrionalis TaxID=329112 RepID=UPI0024786FF4|nr:probable ribonuclease ZC3H12D [Toxorhynchites rutilus septentrionalis]
MAKITKSEPSKFPKPPVRKRNQFSRSQNSKAVTSGVNNRIQRRRPVRAGAVSNRRSAPSRRPMDNGRNRIVLLDACNVGYFHSNHRGFSSEGLRLALQYFIDRNYEVYGLLPKFRLKPGKSSDWTVLDSLYRNGRLIATPCKEFPVRAMCYDDRFMMEIAAKFDCDVVSNDQYRDLMDEKPYYNEVIRRRIPFWWNGNRFVIERDP